MKGLQQRFTVALVALWGVAALADDCVGDSEWSTVTHYYDINKNKINRNYGANWYRVLIAYRQEDPERTLPLWVGQSSTPTSAYTASEAAHSEQLWGGWTPIRTVLECLENGQTLPAATAPSVTIDSIPAGPGGTQIQLGASLGVDSGVYDSLGYFWSASKGNLSGPSSASPTWTRPLVDVDTSYTIGLTLTAYGTGTNALDETSDTVSTTSTASVKAVLPAVSLPTVAIDEIADGDEGTPVQVSAAVAGGLYDGPPQYSWAATEGSFDDHTSASPTWTRPSVNTDTDHTVSLSVTVRGNGEEAARGSVGTVSTSRVALVRSSTPNPLSGRDPLVQQLTEYYEETHYGTAHTRRWGRALAAIIPRGFKSYAPMTLDEAKVFANRGWTRWNPVVTRLEALKASTRVPPVPVPSANNAVLTAILAETSVEDAISALPSIYHKNNVLVFRSEAPGQRAVSHSRPRVVAYGWEAETILTWVTDPNHPAYEHIEFLRLAGAGWDAGVVDYSSGSAVVTRPTDCAGCHTSMNKPLWGSEDVFSGTEQDMTNGRSSRNGSTAIALEALAAADASSDARLTPLTLNHHTVVDPAGMNARKSYGGNGVATDAAYHMMWRHVEAVYEHLKATGKEDEALWDPAFCKTSWADPLWVVSDVKIARDVLTDVSTFSNGTLIKDVPVTGGPCVSSYVCFGSSFRIYSLKQLAESEPEVEVALLATQKARNDRRVESTSVRGGYVRPLDELDYVYERAFSRGEESLRLRGQHGNYPHGVGVSLALADVVKKAFEAAGFCSCTATEPGIGCYEWEFSKP